MLDFDKNETLLNKMKQCHNVKEKKEGLAISFFTTSDEEMLYSCFIPSWHTRYCVCVCDYC